MGRSKLRLFAALYDWVLLPQEQMFLGKLRHQALARVGGRVLEIGIGTGLNLAHYGDAAGVVAIDPNPAMLSRACWRLRRHHSSVPLALAVGEALPFRESSFDYVVGTCVFCTIVDPAEALTEVRRVLKPGGRLVLVEHVRMPNPVWGRVQDLATPLWSQAAGGCHLNRDTRALVERSEMKVLSARTWGRGLFLILEATSG